MDCSAESSHTLSVFHVPDGMTNPMTDDDLVLCRRDRPDLDERITFVGAAIEAEPVTDEHP
jgi:hypothetical protein